ncbi:MAG TPA: ABC transporter substrate-binding protein [Candidatus Rifleibacterium sp.]|nr:ABC transporter substrate-binding protein [Candidatus Rifleibacterium sp.]HPT47679.1 ABC transporter substrate-binding protein [Candidatus Rifleibacterium sp.]
MNTLRNISLIFLVSAVITLSGCGAQKKLPEEIAALLADTSGKVVRLGIYGDPLGLDPLTHCESEHGQMVSNFVHAAPLRKLADGSFVPYLFSEYYLTPGENGTVVLNAVWRRGLKWHDGTDFDPRALDYTIRMMGDPERASPYADLAKGVLSVTSIGQGQQCHMVFAGDSRQFLDLLCVGLLPMHKLATESGSEQTVGLPAVASAPATAGNASAVYDLAAYSANPVGLGPYRVKARVPGQYMLLEPNPFFYDDRVASRPQVLVHSVYDIQQIISDFRVKKYDWINLPSMIAEQLETMQLEQVKFVRYPNQAAMVWMFNTRNPLTADIKVRKALDLLVDRSGVKKQFSADCEELYANPLAASPTLAVDQTTRRAAALKLLEEAGVVDTNNDGRRDYQGKPFEISILINDDNLTRRVVADQMVADLAKSAITASVEAVSWSDFVAKRLRPGEFSTALLSLQLPAAGNWVSLLHSKPLLLDNLNFTGVADQQLDQALAILDSMLAMPDRQKAVEKVGTFLDESRPMAFLLRPLDVGLYHAETGRATADCQIWNDVLNWKLLFGPLESKL